MSLPNHTLTYTYGVLGLVMSETNVLGTFTYGYDGVTSRLASVAYPNGQTSAYTYLDNQGDRRLQTILHRYPDASTLSRFDYTYDAIGNIVTWRQQADTTAVRWTYGYDAADQLTSAVKRATDPQQTVLQRFAYAYDPAGNRTTEQIDDAVTGWTYDALNRLVTQTASGSLRVEGTVSEAATVTVNSVPATVDGANHFIASVPLTAGTNVLTVVATDPSGNTQTATYEVDAAATNRTFTFDPNGNLTSDGSRTFEWDAKNQLVAINQGTHRSEFSYDGRFRRTRIVERENAAVVSDQPFVWDGGQPIQRRDAPNGTVDLFRYGWKEGGVAAYRTHDQIGSTRDVTDGNGGLQARYLYDPSGRTTAEIANVDDPTTFTGVLAHEPSGLLLMTRRAYDPTIARWLSEDPIRLKGGINLYGYVAANPIRWVDPAGTVPMQLPPGMTWPPNGNLLPGFDKDQDMKCTVGVFSDAANSRSCVKQCCQDHDQCYIAFSCNWTSWLMVPIGPCNLCNARAGFCVAAAIFRAPDACDKCKAK